MLYLPLWSAAIHRRFFLKRTNTVQVFQNLKSGDESPHSIGLLSCLVFILATFFVEALKVVAAQGRV
jgi:hypothetical protein